MPASLRIWSDEGRLEHAAIDGRGVLHGLAGGDIDQVAAGGGEGARDRQRIRRSRCRHRPSPSPRCAPTSACRPARRPHRGEDLQREAQPVGERAAILVRAAIGQRREEAGQQVAMGAVQFQHVEAGAGAALRRRRRNRPSPHPCRPASSPAAPGAPGGRGVARPRRAARRRRSSGRSMPSHISLRRALAPGMAELQHELRRPMRMDETDDARPGGFLRIVPQPGAAGGDAGLGRDAGHLGEDQPGTADGARPVMDQVEIAAAGRPRAEYMHMGETTTRFGERHPAQPQGLEHRRQWRGESTACPAPASRGEAAVDARRMPARAAQDCPR